MIDDMMLRNLVTNTNLCYRLSAIRSTFAHYRRRLVFTPVG